MATAVASPTVDPPTSGGNGHASEQEQQHIIRTSLRDMDTLELHSSGGPIDPACIGRMRATSRDTPLAEMRARFQQDGYLWVKGVLPPADVWAMRETYFGYLPGLTKAGTALRDGIFCGDDWRLWMQPGKLRRRLGFEGKNQEYVQRMIAAHREAWYRDFCGHPALKAFIREFTGWQDTTLLERSILRPNVPGGEATHVHYDQIFLRGGPPTSITAWVPIGDCAAAGGGLLYLEGSDAIGRQLEAQFGAAAAHLTAEQRVSAFNETMMDTGYLDKDSGAFGRAWGRKWLCADYEAGDVVLHSPFMIHSSGVNEDAQGRIRLATDLRFVEAGQPFDTRWMKVWVPGDGL